MFYMIYSLYNIDYIGIYFSLLCHFEQLGIQSESGPKWKVLKIDSRAKFFQKRSPKIVWKDSLL